MNINYAELQNIICTAMFCILFNKFTNLIFVFNLTDIFSYRNYCWEMMLNIKLYNS